MIFNAIYSKLISESLLSLYPTFVKKINLPISLQMITRLIAYVLISVFFVNYSFITNNLLSYESITLSFVNLIHIYTAYEGFTNLDSGDSFAIFNIYPLLILLMSGVIWKPGYLFSIIGLLLFIFGNYFNKSKVNNQESSTFYYGLYMIILAALTEAIIYFLIREVKTDNSWNHVFISYFWGTILMTIFVISPYNTNINTNTNTEQSSLSTWWLVSIGLLINGIIGSIGYYLRFNSAYRLDPGTYSLLSYFGIIMAYIYGIIFNNESLTIYKILGTGLIMLANFDIMQNIQ